MRLGSLYRVSRTMRDVMRGKKGQIKRLDWERGRDGPNEWSAVGVDCEGKEKEDKVL